MATTHAGLPVCADSIGAASSSQIAIEGKRTPSRVSTALALPSASPSQVATADNTAEGLGGVASMVQQMHTILVRKDEAENWPRCVPDVTIKDSILTMDIPSKKKGDDGTLRAHFPVHTKDLPGVPAFSE